MCLEFLCSWCHQEEDGPDTHRQSHHTSLPPASKPPINSTEYPARGESPSKPRSERPNNGTDTWNSDTYPGRHDPPSKPRSEMSSNGSDTWNDDAYPARQDPPLKPHPEPYNGNKNQVVSGVAVNGDTKPKAENPKTSSMVFNGEKDLKAVYPRPSALAPQVANNTVSAAPVPQPNPRIGADSNLMHTNNHYPTVGDSAQRNGYMRK